MKIILKNYIDCEEDVEISQWYVQPGEEFKADQPILEVLMNKASVDIVLGKAGRLDKILCEEGEIVAPDQEVAEITEL